APKARGGGGGDMRHIGSVASGGAAGRGLGTPRDRKIKKAEQKISKLASQLDVGTGMVNTAVEIFGKYIDGGEHKGKKLNSVYAACLYIALCL
ncbi:hypothetical protein KIPB_014339, partial [Kipferlia bialata]